MSDSPLLSVEGLTTAFFTDKETVHAVNDVNLDIDRGQTVGLVGESGSGKSVTARSLTGLVDAPGRILDGQIKYRHPETVDQLAAAYPSHVAHGTTSESDVFVYNGPHDRYVDLTAAPESALRSVRGGDIAMVFQDPLSCLNPVYTVGNQVEELLRIHRDLSGRERTETAIDLLDAVGIPDPARRLKEYPHEFSGGMRQRAVIAMGLACDPEVLVCDEPTTALDVTIQAQVIDLLTELQASRDLALLFITHDMGVIAQVADRVSVMYAGEVVEHAPVKELFTAPAHPYTRELLASIPGQNPGTDRLPTIEGDVPTPTGEPTACRFAPRCPDAFDACHDVVPAHVSVGTDRTAACLLYPSDTAGESAQGARRESDSESNSADHAEAASQVNRTTAVEPPADRRTDSTTEGTQ
jgi:peptide/nickel transport system ATP-binding protein